MTEYALGPWLPDVTDFRNPGLEEAKNVIPGPDGYIPAREFLAGPATVSGTIIGAKSVYLEDGSVLVACATLTDLFVVRNGTVTASGLSLTLSELDVVVFEQFNRGLYASTKNGAMWALTDVETYNTFAAITAPSANALGRVADFLVAGDLVDIDATDDAYRIRWSKFNNPSGTWETSISEQSGAISLDAKYGPVTAITGGTRGLVFQRQGVSRLTYTGGSNVFRLDTFEQNRGCVAPSSAVRVGEQTYYLAHDGFFVTDGATPRPISTGKVWTWFLANCTQSFFEFVTGAVDYERRAIVWLFPGDATQSFTGQLWFHWETGKWSYVEQALQWAIEGVQPGISIEGLAADYPDLDAMPLSLDSPEFLPSRRNLQAFSGGALGSLTGNTLQAEFVTGDLHPISGQRSFIEEIWPLVEADQVNVALGQKDRMTATYMESAEVAMGSVGFAAFNADARYFRVIMRIPASQEWGNAYGFKVNAQPSGAT